LAASGSRISAVMRHSGLDDRVRKRREGSSEKAFE
jgi:hypothetical protein